MTTSPTSDAPKPKATGGIAKLLGAMFFMATSSFGPGFIVQTTHFTAQIGAAFAFAIVVSVLVDIAIQLNVWRVIGVSGLRANDLGNQVLPGLGWLLGLLIFAGGIVFNIGNIGGTGLGMRALFGVSPQIGGVISGLIATAIFLSRRAGVALDKIVVMLGVLMIGLTTYVAITSGPPVVRAAKNIVAPDQIDFVIITTLIGGTIGGYITYAGAHRMVDSGITGPEAVAPISRTSVAAILVTGVMRVVLFLAILGVVAGGVALSGQHQAAQAFQSAAGTIGKRLFGIVIWAAGLTSTIGASYTSISFVTPSGIKPYTKSLLTCGFILICTVLFAAFGKTPTQLLLFAGAINGLILPISFTVLLWVAWMRRDLMNGYDYPKWLLGVGSIGWLLTVYLGYESISGVGKLWS